MLFFRFINTIPIQSPTLSQSSPEVAPVMSKAATVFTIPPPQPVSSEDEYDGLPTDVQFLLSFAVSFGIPYRGWGVFLRCSLFLS